MGQRHDHLFQVLFADPEHAAPLLPSALPSRLAERIDWRTLTRCPPGLRGRSEGRTTLLLRQIARRFGPDAAAAAEPRLRAATRAELDLLADRVLDAATLDELLRA